MENVPEVMGADNVKHFSQWLNRLESFGYSNFFQIINAKDFCIPQNRRRCFMISILGDYGYDFPIKHKLKYRLKDFLESNVDEKYYLSKEDIKRIASWKSQQKPLENIEKNIEECPSLITHPKFGIAIKENTEQGYKVATVGDGVNIASRMKHQRGNVQKGSIQTLKAQMEIGVVVDDCSFTDLELQLFTPDLNLKRYVGSDKVDELKEGQMGTITFPNGYGHGPRTHDESIALNTVDRPIVKHHLRIRKLVPLETIKLMGYEEKDYLAMREIGMSDSQIYHCAGDSLVPNIVASLIGQMTPMSEQEVFDKIENYTDSLVKE